MKNSKTHGPTAASSCQLARTRSIARRLADSSPRTQKLNPRRVRPSHRARDAVTCRGCWRIGNLPLDATHPRLFVATIVSVGGEGTREGTRAVGPRPRDVSPPAPRLGPRASAKPLRATLPGPRLARLPRPMSHANPFADDDESSAFAGEGAASFHSTRLVGSSFARDNPFAGARDGDEAEVRDARSDRGERGDRGDRGIPRDARDLSADLGRVRLFHSFQSKTRASSKRDVASRRRVTRTGESNRTRPGGGDPTRGAPILGSRALPSSQPFPRPRARVAGAPAEPRGRWSPARGRGRGPRRRPPRARA